ncbi:endonuclease domain-containing protein [Chryseobacterium gwangjuense]|uniref:endonuclease domain-containing protein n=1 Tax=Chryseobacterium gwangjuense TaxID=1069980 RepID=UPI001E4C0BEC|nr:endonuclease domain-containing protein [Chryseobacterium gwangjuense]MCE3075823.1 endonuclease domain-containing protein [Chryseobacterium gwangjuense]
MKNPFTMTEKQINICKNSLEELKILYLENQHFYTPVDVYYKPSGKQFKKWALLSCNEHDCEPFEQDIQDARILRRSKKCPECLSIIQSENTRIPIVELNRRIQLSTEPLVINKQTVIKYSEKLHNNNTVVMVKCNLFGHHKEMFPQTAVSIGKNNICPECCKTRDYKKKNGEDLIDKINDILKNKNNSFSFFGSINRNNKGIIFYELICENCGCSEWEREKYVESVKCKVCYPNDTLGESRVIKYLNFQNITFKKQKKFPGLKNNMELKCDFFIPKLNLIIEYDGHQHYYPIDYFKGFKSFKNTIKCDWIKNRYALKNRINILRIPFKEYDNLENLIDDAIAKINSQEHSFKNYYNFLNVYRINYISIIVNKRMRLKKILLGNKRKPYFLSDLDKKKYQ